MPKETVTTDLEPEAIACTHCDFGTGQRGMDFCGRCDGTGSVFLVKGKYYPNTEWGYNQAKEQLNAGTI